MRGVWLGLLLELDRAGDTVAADRSGEKSTLAASSIRTGRFDSKRHSLPILHVIVRSKCPRLS